MSAQKDRNKKSVAAEPHQVTQIISAAVAQRQRLLAGIASDGFTLVKVDVEINYLISLGEGGGLIEVEALRFKNREKVFCHCIAIWVPSSCHGRSETVLLRKLEYA